MARYIDKDALVAEIERKINKINLDSIEDWRYRLQREHDIEVMKNIISLINTLEVKEVDFDALGILAEHLIACEAHAVTPKYREEELDILEGLANNKAQKEE